MSTQFLKIKEENLASDYAWKSLTSSSLLEATNIREFNQGVPLHVDKAVQAITKEGRVDIKPEEKLTSLNYTKTHYKNKDGVEVAFSKPLGVFDVKQYTETLFDLAFKSHVQEVVLKVPEFEDKKVVGSRLVDSKARVVEVPKNYKNFIKFQTESIKALVKNITQDHDIANVEAKREGVEKEVDKIEVAKNLGRLVALVETYPNVLPVLPTYIIDFPLIQEAFIAGKREENLVDIDKKLNGVFMYSKSDLNDGLETTSQFKPVLRGIKILANSPKSKEKALILASNIKEALSGKEYTMENIKGLIQDEYTKAKSDLAVVKEKQAEFDSKSSEKAAQTPAKEEPTFEEMEKMREEADREKAAELAPEIDPDYEILDGPDSREEWEKMQVEDDGLGL